MKENRTESGEIGRIISGCSLNEVVVEHGGHAGLTSVYEQRLLNLLMEAC